VASEFGLLEDSNPQSPGGNYSSGSLGCSSCHDPHGQVASGLPIEGSGSYGAVASSSGTAVGNYRLLGMQGYKNLTSGPPTAVTYSMFGPNAERDNRHTDYGSGMSEFCANCHFEMLTAATGEHTHPAGASAGFAGLDVTYNAYVATGDMSGTQADSYDHFVPFERGQGAALSSTTTAGPDSGSNVMCLTCHRAHASAFEYALRWQPDEPLLAESDYVTANPNAYYGEDIATRYGEWQRSLCNKCHGWD